MTSRSKLIRIAATAALLALATACGNSANGSSESSLTGTISGNGSSTVFPITEAVAEEFKKENPGVDVTVGVAGTGGGFEKFCNGEIDLQDASRPIKDNERAACSAKGIEYVELQVAVDGLAVVVNPEADWVECLTVAQLKAIWQPNSKVDNWRRVPGGSFPSRPLKLFGPGTDSGTFDYFTGEINGEEGASRSDYTASEDDNVLVQGVAGTKGALGYFGFAYFSENREKLKVLGVDGGTGCVVPSNETVKDNTYSPLSRPLFVYVKKASLARAEVKAFMTYYMANVNELLADVGYTPMSDEVLLQETQELAQAAA